MYDRIENGYLTVRVRATDYRVGPRTKYKIYLPESMNDVWEPLRQQSRKRLAMHSHAHDVNVGSAVY